MSVILQTLSTNIKNMSKSEKKEDLDSGDKIKAAVPN